MNHNPIPIANADWALSAFGDADREIAMQLLRREAPTLRRAYIARRREINPERRWNWCSACNVEIKVRHVRKSIVQCPSCLRYFEEVHRAFSLITRDFYDCDYLRLVRGDALPDGSLAYDVKPFELPTRSVFVGVKALSRRERRRRARRGRRGRRWNGKGTMRVAAHEDNHAQEPYEPAYWREFATTEFMPVPYPWDIDAIPPAETLDYSRQPIGVGIHICERCRCEIRLVVTLYIEWESPQLTQCILRGLQLAARRFGADAMYQERCLCNPTTHFHPLPGHASERPAP